VAGLVLFLTAAVVVFVLVRGPKSAVLPGDQPSRSAGTEQGADTRANDAAALLEQLEEGLRGDSKRSLLALAAPGVGSARRELETMRANVRVLRISDLDFRYVDEDGGRLSPGRQRALGGRGWVADVQVSWRIGGYDTGSGHLGTTMTFAETPTGAAFVSARDNFGEAAPLWMLDRVSVQRGPLALVVSTNEAGGRFAGLARQAVVDVRKVLPAWHGRLVVEVPDNERQLARVLGSEPGAYGGIAAVTTTVDGSQAPDAPTHIFVNPPIFDPLGPRGSQIVMSHEATHVATHAATSAMPTWLLEGFADYAALAHVDLPVSVTASQILTDVRKSGAPRNLPGAKEFDPRNKALGASYEAAWLACRLIAEQYGEQKLIELYRAVDRQSATAGPFRSVLGTDEAAFTRQWRDYLRRLAG
jgi:hypothetical protein